MRENGLRSKVHGASPYNWDCKEIGNGPSISLSKNEFFVVSPIPSRSSKPHFKNVGTTVNKNMSGLNRDFMGMLRGINGRKNMIDGPGSDFIAPSTVYSE